MYTIMIIKTILNRFFDLIKLALMVIVMIFITIYLYLIGEEDL